MRSLAILWIAVSVSVGAAAAVPAHGAPRPPACWPKGSASLAVSEHARVFRSSDGDAVFACLYSRPRLFRLGGHEVERPAALAGRFAAYVHRFRGDEEGEPYVEIRVTDVRTGRRVRSGNAWDDPVAGVGYDTLVHRLVVRRTGGTAWIASDFHEVGRRTNQVWRMDDRGVRVLAEGDDVEPRSLRLCGRGRVCWRQAGQERRASLR